jgi:nucleoside-diphosphate-sugar epimerase
MNILVTGGAGYVGSSLAHYLLIYGHKVTILDNFMYGYDSILSFVNDSDLEVIKQDIRNPIDAKKYDVIYHLAAVSGLPACEANRSASYQINVEATDNLVKSLSKSQIMVYASTTSFYGKSGEVCNEESPIDPVSWYGKTKYQAEQIVMQRENSISLRFATIYGVGYRMRMDLLINDFVYKAIKEKVIVIFDPDAKRTYISINSAVDAYFECLCSTGALGRIINVGSEEFNLSKMQVAQEIKKQVDFDIIVSGLEDKDKRDFIIDFSKMKKYIDCTFYPLEDGIKKLVKLCKFYDYYQHYRTI